jgi:nitrogen regulatory protein PII-like uncharacterized protein
MKPVISTLKAEMRKTIFAEQEHLAVTINELLDVVIDEFYPDEEYLGLVPTFLPAFQNQEEYDLVMERALPPEGQSTLLPVLMCPEDLDLLCTVIVAKVKTQGDLVVWEKLGLDKSKPNKHPHSVGTEVQWLNKMQPMYFKKEAYIACLNAFKEMAQ